VIRISEPRIIVSDMQKVIGMVTNTATSQDGPLNAAFDNAKQTVHYYSDVTFG